MSDAKPLRACLNCETPLEGVFCHRCGQKDLPARPSLKELLAQVLQEFLPFERRILSSFWLLVSRPGFLAGEYLQGRRVRHVPPFRLYVVTSFLVFFLFSVLPNGDRNRASKPKIQVVDLDIQTGSTSPDGAALAAGSQTRTRKRPPWADELIRRAKKASSDPEQVKHVFLSHLSRALFLLMPLFALLLMGLHCRSHTLFMDHMVVSLHHHTLSFLVILVMVGLGSLPGENWGGCLGFLLFLVPPIHLGFTLQRLYQRGWFRSFAKAAVVSALYGLVLAVALLGLLLLALPK